MRSQFAVRLRAFLVTILFYYTALIFWSFSVRSSIEARYSKVGFIAVSESGAAYCTARPTHSRCCTRRDDECTARIRVPTGRVRRRYDAEGRRIFPNEYKMTDHLCYCDRFCDRSITLGGGNDCCPDYVKLCENSKGSDPVIFRSEDEFTGYQSNQKNSVLSTNNFASFSASENECFESGIAYGYGQAIRRNCRICTCLGNRWDCDYAVCLIQEELLQRMNRKRYSWTARNYTNFWGRTLEDGIRRRLGTLFPEKSVENMNEILVRRRELPRQFDARRRWLALATGAPLRDQGECASSWAFSTVQVAADRLAIVTGASVRIDLAAQQLVDCNNANGQRGCHGGFLDRAWWYIRKLGLVAEDCYPYTSGQTGLPGTCIPRSSLYSASPFPACPSGSTNNTVYKMTPPYRISTVEEDIRAEILTNGPVQATFLVHADFFMYGGGIYRHIPSGSSTASGYHSVKILGLKEKTFSWGDEVSADGTLQKYWICANSWGPHWGESGHFRIVRGENHCEIESFIIGAWGKPPWDTIAAVTSRDRYSSPSSFTTTSAARIQNYYSSQRTTSRPDFRHFTRLITPSIMTTVSTSTTNTIVENITSEITTEPTTNIPILSTTIEDEDTASSSLTTYFEATTSSTTLTMITSKENSSLSLATISTDTTTIASTSIEAMTSQENILSITENVENIVESNMVDNISDGKLTSAATISTPLISKAVNTITEGIDYLNEDLVSTISSTTENTTVTEEAETTTTEEDYDEYIKETMSTIFDAVTETTAVTEMEIAPESSSATKNLSEKDQNELEILAGGVTEFVGITERSTLFPVRIGIVTEVSKSRITSSPEIVDLDEMSTIENKKEPTKLPNDETDDMNGTFEPSSTVETFETTTIKVADTISSTEFKTASTDDNVENATVIDTSLHQNDGNSSIMASGAREMESPGKNSVKIVATRTSGSGTTRARKRWRKRRGKNRELRRKRRLERKLKRQLKLKLRGMEETREVDSKL